MGRLLAREFSGPSLFCSSTFIQVPDTLRTGAMLDTMTFMAWINPDLPDRSIIETSTGNAYGLRYTPSRRLGFYYNGILIGDAAATFIQPRRWAHCAVTYNRVSGMCAFYINGVFAHSAVNSLVQTAPTSAYRVAGGVSNFSGNLADPAIFNRVLFADEIRAIYENGLDAYAKDGSCVLDYRFTEGPIGGIANEIIDFSGRANHGTLTMGSGRISPYNIPVPNRVVIPSNMPLVGLRSEGTNAITVPNANLAAAFNVTAGQIGVNGLSGGAWVKKQRFATSWQQVAGKGTFGASGYGGIIECGDSLNALGGQVYGPGSISVATTTIGKNGIAHTHITWINGVSYGHLFHNGLAVRRQSAVLTGNGPAPFTLIGTGSGNLVLASLFFLANRILTNSEIYNIYSKTIFPPDVLFWHGQNESGLGIACYRGAYSPNRRVPACDATLPSGVTFTNDTPWV